MLTYLSFERLMAKGLQVQVVVTGPRWGTKSFSDDITFSRLAFVVDFHKQKSWIRPVSLWLVVVMILVIYTPSRLSHRFAEVIKLTVKIL